MKDCERLFGVLRCNSFGDDECAMAINEALNGGKVLDLNGFLNVLRQNEFSYVLRLLVTHSIDELSDPEVIAIIPQSYKNCIARATIAGAARIVLAEMTEDELGDINHLGRITFGLSEIADE